MQNDPVLIKLSFRPFDPNLGVRGWGSMQAKYLRPCRCVRCSLEVDMKHDHFLEKLYLDLLTPSPGSGRGVCWHLSATMLLRS